MKTCSLQIYPREDGQFGKNAVRRLRQRGLIPANILRHGQSESIQLLAVDFQRLEQQGLKTSTLIEGVKATATSQTSPKATATSKTLPTATEAVKTSPTVATSSSSSGGAAAKELYLVKSLQRHPVTGKVLHVDFYHVRPGRKVSLLIPIEGTGVPAGVKAGGILEQKLGSLRVKAASEAIREKLEVDLTGLQIGASFKIADLKLPPAWENVLNPQQIVFKVSYSRLAMAGEETSDAPEGSAASVPTVKGKKEEIGTETE